MLKTDGKRRVFLVDDHPMVRERLGQLIDREEDMVVCGEAESAPEAVGKLAALAVDVAVVDLSLKDSRGLELIKDLKAIKPQLPVLVLSMHDESLYAERVLRAGARGYITKQEATTKVLVAIRRVLAGDVYLSEQMVGRLLDRCSSGVSFAASPVETLADRELEVLQLIGRGRGTRQIAAELRISVKTVETYRARIKEKLRLSGASDLVQYAIQWVGGMMPG
jgi:DNA-binding NarL/FixJ family response regulator